MEGQFVPPTVSSTRRGPVIVLDSGKGGESEVTIRGGYPGLRDGDPDKRDVKELKAALVRVDKLKAEK